MVQDRYAHVYMASGNDRQILNRVKTRARSARKGTWKNRRIQEPRKYRANQKARQKRGNFIRLILLAGALTAVLL